MRTCSSGCTRSLHAHGAPSQTRSRVPRSAPRWAIGRHLTIPWQRCSTLKQHYKLVILSNVDRASFAATLPRLGVPFDAVFTAQDIGSYKPDPRNFAYLVDRLAAMGIAKTDILHTAQSLFHDHAPANAAGLASAWIDRRQDAAGWGATSPPPPGVRYDFRFPCMAGMVQAHQAESRG